MNEEIKEILKVDKQLLDKIENILATELNPNEYDMFYNYFNEIRKPNILIDIKDVSSVKNFITNLQEENQKLKEQLNCKEYFSSTMPENTEFVILTKNNYDRQQKDLALENIQLKQENQKLNKIIDELERWLKEDEEKAATTWEMGRCFNMFDILNKLTELKKEVE